MWFSEVSEGYQIKQQAKMSLIGRMRGVKVGAGGQDRARLRCVHSCERVRAGVHMHTRCTPLRLTHPAKEFVMRTQSASHQIPQLPRKKNRARDSLKRNEGFEEEVVLCKKQGRMQSTANHSKATSHAAEGILGNKLTLGINHQPCGITIESKFVLCWPMSGQSEF